MSARWPAISARRRRRMSSSLLPLNIGPQTTSSQPPRSGKSLITWPTLMGRSDGLSSSRSSREAQLRDLRDGLLCVLELVLREAAEADDAEQPAVLRHRQ